MNTENQIPEGYMKNSRGDLVRIENIKPIDLLKDQSANELAKQAIDIHMALVKFKRMALDDIQELIKTAGEKYDLKLGGDKGNITISSFNGRYKVQRTFADQINFGLELEAAKELFLRYLDEVTAGTDGEIRALIDGAFRTTNNGSLRTADLLRLLKYDIKHPNWVQACEALKDSISVDGKTVYVRVSERINDSDKYRPIPLGIAAVGGGYVSNH
jgi:hypothetical protein